MEIAEHSKTVRNIKVLMDIIFEMVVTCLTFIGPVFFLFLALGTNLYLIFKPLLHTTITFRSYPETFSKARIDVAVFWSWYGRIVHAHQILGLGNIPDQGPAVIVYYHGAIPIDYAILLSRILLEKKRIVRSVVDKYMIWLPGLEVLVQGFGFHSSSRSKCSRLLRQGHLLGVAPGGGYEAQLGTNDYKLLWKKRSGFAAIATESGNVPIIPVFTENIREAYINQQCFLPVFEKIFSMTKIPAVPLYGGFPVRLRTHVGQPIYPNDHHGDVESLRQATVDAMEALISKNQGPTLQNFFP